MSGQVYEVGSVVNFVAVPIGRPPSFTDSRGVCHWVVGYATVVTKRSMGVVDTVLVPVIMVDAEMVFIYPDREKKWVP